MTNFERNLKINFIKMVGFYVNGTDKDFEEASDNKINWLYNKAVWYATEYKAM